MGDTSKEPTEEELDKSNELRKQAMEAFNMQDYQKAVETYTDAIILNPQGSMLYAKRGQAYLHLKKPNACIRDCERALELNPDSAAAHKFRGRAHQLLGNWEEAATDLRTACKFDFDEQVDEWLKEVLPNVSNNPIFIFAKIINHKHIQLFKKKMFVLMMIIIFEEICTESYLLHSLEL